MGNPFFGGIGNLGMRPVGQPSAIPPVAVPPVSAQSVNRSYNAYVTPAPAPAPVMPLNNTMSAIQAITPQSNIIWVDSPEEIQNYPSGRGWQQWFGDKNALKLYVRETDSNGVMQPIRTVWMQFEEPAASVASTESQPSVSAEQVNATAPAASVSGPTREEFDAVVELAKTTSANVSDLTGIVKALNGKFDELMK